MANKFKKLFVFAFLTLVSVSCLPMKSKSRLAFKTLTSPAVEETIPDDVDYEYLKKHVLEPQCIRCHEGMGIESKLSWWYVPGEPEESELFLWMKDGSMPPSRPATTRELEIVRRYIEHLSLKNRDALLIP